MGGGVWFCATNLLAPNVRIAPEIRPQALRRNAHEHREKRASGRRCILKISRSVGTRRARAAIWLATSALWVRIRSPLTRNRTRMISIMVSQEPRIKLKPVARAMTLSQEETIAITPSGWRVGTE